MSEKRKVRPPQGPGRGYKGPGEKPKDFKTAMKKVLKYMRKNVVSVAIALLLSVGAILCTLNIPNILGSATDEIISGIMNTQVLESAGEIKSGFEGFKNAIDSYDEQTKQMLLENKQLTLKLITAQATNSSADMSKLEGLAKMLEGNEQALNLTVGELYLMADKVLEAKTVGELFEAASAIMPGEAEGSIPEKYRQMIYELSIDAKPGVDGQKVLNIVLTIALLVGIAYLLQYFQSFLLSDVSQKISYRFRKDLYHKINTLPLKYFDTKTHGEVMSYITNDVDTLATSLNQSLSQLLTSLVTLVGVLIMMIGISVWLTLAALIMLPLSLLLVSLIVKKSQRHFVAQQDNLSSVNGHIEEMYGGHMVVKLNNGEEKAKAQFEEENEKLYKSGWKSQFLSGLMMPVTHLVGNLGFVCVCVLGGFLTLNGSITVGNIQAFIQYVRQFNQPISQMANILNTLQSTAAAAERIFDFLEQPEEIETGTKELEDIKGEVEFKNVRFGYNKDKIIINDFSIKVEPGKRIAIVGPTGAGKTTVVKLLMRFYDLNSGQIMLDGEDIKDITKHSLRDAFAMVLQETWLFNGTIMENIRYGRPDATDEEVVAAAKAASVHHFIKTLPGGYNFVINEEAANVSHGQRQLLTIARAILSKPRLLILDEATSSVDTRTEMLIQKAMENLMKDKTSFIIAHRLSTIRDADLILVMKDGDIIETGTHSSLLKANGFYADLYKSQFEEI